jgi:hypothetical protein
VIDGPADQKPLHERQVNLVVSATITVASKTSAQRAHGHLEQGMHVLTKPFAMDTVAERIRTLVDFD